MVHSAIRRSAVVSMIFATLAFAHATDADEPKCWQPQAVVDPIYKSGQVWSYKTRPGEESSTITILRVESTPKLGVIVHVRIDGFQFKDCEGAPGPTKMEHAPFAKAAIDKSVLRLLRTESKVPDYTDGYGDWLSHCDGVYTISVAEMLTATNEAFKSGSGCHS